MRGLWALRGFATKYWRVILISILVMAVAGGVNALAVNRFDEVFKPLFQALTGPDSPGGDMQKLWHEVLILLSWLVAAAVLQAISQYLGEWIGQNTLYDLRRAVFNHLQLLSMKFFDRQRSGELISRVNNDTQRLQQVLGSQLANLVVAPVTVLVAFERMLDKSWRLALAGTPG